MRTESEPKITQSTHKELSSLQQEIVAELTKAENSEARVRMYGELVDTYGVDALVGFLLPEMGDATSSIISGLYLLFEAKAAGLSKTEYLKIVGLQTADMFVGAIPIVGDIADYFFQANKWSTGFFEKRAEELEKKARELGIDESQIAQIRTKAEILPQIVGEVVKTKQELA